MPDSETKSRSALANGLQSLVVMPMALGIPDSPHILGWFGGTGFPDTTAYLNNPRLLFENNSQYGDTNKVSGSATVKQNQLHSSGLNSLYDGRINDQYGP